MKIPKVGADYELKPFELAPATPTAWWQRVQGILGAVVFHGRDVTSPRPVLCVGLKSSASTWVFNVVVEILRASRGDISQMSRTVSPGAAFEPGGVMSFYSDAIEAFPEGAEHAGYLVIKTHKPARSLRYLAGAGGAKVLISVREPRDAVASLMQRFDLPFETSSANLSSAHNMLSPWREAVLFFCFGMKIAFTKTWREWRQSRSFWAFGLIGQKLS